MKVSFLFVEFIAVALFIFGFFKCLKQGRLRALEFFLIFVYGFLLELLDMRFFKSYQYSTDFTAMVYGVPLSIAMLWAVIVYGAMEISDASGIPETARPFFDGLLAVWIDLALDAIAIRMHYWSWSIPLNEGWFGVPAGNLYAWIWVAFFYSVFARSVRLLCEKNLRWAWLYPAVPLISYLFLFVQLHVAGYARHWFGLETANQRLWLFAAQFLVFAMISLYHLKDSRPVHRPDFFWTGSRLFIHGYFLTCFFLFKIYREAPVIGLIAIVTLIGEFILSLRGKVSKHATKQPQRNGITSPLRGSQ